MSREGGGGEEGRGGEWRGEADLRRGFEATVSLEAGLWLCELWDEGCFGGVRYPPLRLEHWRTGGWDKEGVGEAGRETGDERHHGVEATHGD